MGHAPLASGTLKKCWSIVAIVQTRPRLGGLGGRVGRYYLDNKEIRFPLSKLLVPRFLVYQEKLYHCVMSIIHTVTYISQNPKFVEVEVIFFNSLLYQNVRTFNQFNSEIL